MFGKDLHKPQWDMNIGALLYNPTSSFKVTDTPNIDARCASIGPENHYHVGDSSRSPGQILIWGLRFAFHATALGRRQSFLHSRQTKWVFRYIYYCYLLIYSAPRCSLQGCEKLVTTWDDEGWSSPPFLDQQAKAIIAHSLRKSF